MCGGLTVPTPDPPMVRTRATHFKSRIEKKWVKRWGLPGGHYVGRFRFRCLSCQTGCVFYWSLEAIFS